MRIDAEQLIAEGLSLELDSPGVRRRVELAPSRAVTGYYAHSAAGHRIVATASPGLVVRSFDWQVGGLRVAAGSGPLAQPARLDDVRVDLDIPRTAGASGTIGWQRARLDSLGLWLPGLSQPIDLVGVAVQDLSVELDGGTLRIRAARVAIARAAVTQGKLAVDVDDILFTDLRVDGEDVTVADIEVGAIRLHHADLHGALLSRPTDGGADDQGESIPARYRLDLGFADCIDGQLDVDLTADATVPLIGRRKATHRFRIPIADGSIDFKQVENDLAALEDAVLDFVFKKGALHLVKDIPLIPYDARTLVYWPLDDDEHDLAARDRVRLRRLPTYRIPTSTRSSDSGGEPSVALRTLHFDNLAIDLSVGGPATVEVAGGRIVLGSEGRAAIGSLRVQGDIHHDTSDPTDITSVELESGDWELQLEALGLAGRLLDVELLTLASIARATVTFEDVRPGAVDVAAQGLHLRGVQLRSSSDG